MKALKENMAQKNRTKVWVALLATAIIALGVTLSANQSARADSTFPRAMGIPPSGGPSSVAISGPATGVLEAEYTFTATTTGSSASSLLNFGPVFPANLPPLGYPLTYVWQAQGQLPFTHTVSTAGVLIDSAVITWTAAGSNHITVTVSNSSGAATSSTIQFIDSPPQATLSVVPTNSQQSAGSIFTLTLQAESGAALFDTVDAYLTFDPSALQVVDAADAPATSIIANTAALPDVTYNVVDNLAGSIDYSASRFSGQSSGSVALASIRVRALSGISQTHMTFLRNGARQSDLMLAGNYLAAGLGHAAITYTYRLAPFAGEHGSITPGVTQTVVYGAAQVFSVTADSGYHVTDVGVDGVSQGVRATYAFDGVNANHTITAAFAINTYVLTPNAGVNGSISPSTPQTVNYSGTQVFAIAANTGYHLLDVGVDGASMGMMSAYTFTNVAANHTITAAFAINTYTLTPDAGANGSISPSTAQTANYSATQVFAITANTGYHIVDVGMDGVSVGAVNAYTFTNVTANHTITAAFAINQYVITVTVGGHGLVEPGTTVTVNFGVTQTFMITPENGYHIDDVVVDNFSYGAPESVDFPEVSDNHTLSVTFAINTYVLTPNAGANGAITPNTAQTVSYSATQVFVITANTGYHITDVGVDGASVGAVNAYTFTNVTANHTITATYAINTYTLTPNAGANGSISPNTAQTVNYSGTQVFAIAANTGYHIVDVGVDGASVGAVSQYTFTNVAANHTITATYTINTFVITPTPGDHGAITPGTAQTVNYSASQMFGIAANTGYHIADVGVDGASVGAVSQYTFTNVAANHTITAAFAINMYVLTPDAGANGVIAPDTAQTVAYGASQIFTITPNANYRILDVGVDGASVGMMSAYTFTNVTANHTITAVFAHNTFVILPTAGANGVITPGSAQTVLYGASQVFTITANANYHIADVLTDSASVGAVSQYTFTNVTANHTISAAFAINTFALTTTMTGNGAGTIGKSPDQALYDYGTVVTLTATPLISSSFSGWSGACANASGACVVTMTAARSVTATFTLNTYLITPTAGLSGTITPNTPQTVAYGGSRTFTATASTGAHLVDVTVDGLSVGTLPTYTFSNVTASHTITAAFAVNTYVITPMAGLSGTITPDTPQTVNYGGSQTFTMTPDANYHIASLRLDGSAVTIANPYTINNVTANHTFSATFAINTFRITATVTAGSGVITPSGTLTYAYGSSASYTITAATGYHVVDVGVDGASQGAVGLYVFTSISANHTLTAAFAINTFVITPSAGPNGVITPAAAVAVNYGASQAFTITANPTYHILDVQADGASVGATGRYTFTNVTTTHTITAAFTINTFRITATAGLNGAITPGGTQTLDYGASQTFTITPNTGYHIVDVRTDGTSRGAVGLYTFSSITANHTISAAFAINTYVITPTAVGSGSITPSTAQTVMYGASQAFTVTANNNYHILDVFADGVSQGATSHYTFTYVTANHILTAAFTINTYLITPTAGLNGSITPSVTQMVDRYADQTFTITPDTGYHIVDVRTDGTSRGAVTQYRFSNVRSNHIITASFAINTYLITPTAGANGSITPGTPQTVAYGEERAFAITANTGYHIVDVGVDGAGGDASAPGVYTFTNVIANHTLTATFAIDTFVITPTAGANGSITPDTAQTVNYSATQVFAIAANTGYHIADVGVDGVSVGVMDAYTYSNVMADHTITATFAINTYTLTPDAGVNGSITPNAAQTVDYSATQAFAIGADTGYHIADVGVDGASVGAVNQYTFTNVTANHTLTAVFAINTYTLLTGITGNGSGEVSAEPNQPTYEHGTVVTLTATPSITSTFIEWGGDISGLSNPITLTMDGARTITATFSKTCDPVAGAAIDRQPGGVILTGDLIHFTAVASGTLPMASAWTLDGIATGGSQSWLEQSFATAGDHTIAVTVTNACGAGVAQLAFTVTQPANPRADLSRSQKLVTRNSAGLTYTLMLRNAVEVTGTVMLTDPLPAGVTFVAGSLSASTGTATYASGQALWTGEVISGTPVLIVFAVAMDAGTLPDTVITNQAMLDDGSGAIVRVSADTTMNPTLSLTINDGAVFTRIPTVTLSYSSTIALTDVRFSNDGLFLNNSGWISAGISGVQPDWVVATDGDLRIARAVYAQFRDAEGKTYGPVKANITYDPDAPTTPILHVLEAVSPGMLRAMQANLGLTVTVQIGSSDENSGVRIVVLSNDAAFTDPVTHTLSGATTTIEWPVPATMYQIPHIYVKSYDRAGNESALIVDKPLVYQVFMMNVLR